MFRFVPGVALALSLIVAPASVCRADDSPAGRYLTNVELMHLAVREAVADALQGMPAVEGGRIALRPVETSEIDWLVETELLGRLASTASGVRLYEGRRSNPGKAKRNRKSEETPVMPATDKPPVFKSGPPVGVPEQACEKGLGGVVTARLIVNESGGVANTVIEESAGSPFDEAVETGVASWLFDPAGKDGEPVIGTVYCRFEFPVVPKEECGEKAIPGEFLDGFEPKGEETAKAAPPPAADDVPTLAYRVSELEFLYPGAGRRFVIGPKRVERFGRTRIDLRLEKGGDVVWASSAEHYVSDRVPAGALHELEGSGYEFARPPMPESGIGKVVEPLAVAGVLGGMIVLFYTNQAGD